MKGICKMDKWIQRIFIVSCIFCFFSTAYKCQGDEINNSDFLLQRMMITKLRINKGEKSAENLLKELIAQGKQAGMKIPDWVYSKSSGDINFIRPDRAGVASGKYDSIIFEASRKYKIPSALIKSVIYTESGFFNEAISSKGAQGLMQLMPETSQDLGIRDPFKPESNIFGGARLLRSYMVRFGSLKKTLIAYNAGASYVLNDRTIPKETERYIKKVIYYYKHYKK